MRILLGFVLLLSLSCKGTKDLQSCSEAVRVEDHSSLDGCGFLLITEAGKKLLPINGSDYELTDQAKAMVSYREVEDAMGICMAEDLIIELTCFSILTAENEVPRKAPCLETTNPNEKGWLQAVMQDWQPTKVDRYEYLDGFAYLCMRPEMSKLYDCQGTLLCTTGVENESCAKEMSSLKNKMTIWVAHR